MVEGAAVVEEQMSALFGEGLHPDTDILTAQGVQLGECKLGRSFPVYVNDVAVLAALREEEKRFRLVVGRRPTEQERSDFVVEIATPFFKKERGRVPEDGREVVAWVTAQQKKVRQAVSSFDLTFSPVKSVSVVWALADEDLADRIAALHHEAVAEAVAWAEEKCALSRRGKGGVEQVSTRGFIGSRFTHFDTRGGDPDLHDHVLIANKALCEDGVWRSLDGQALFEHVQAISGRYNAVLQHKLQSELGFVFEERVRDLGKPGVWEIAGVSEEMIDVFSSRRRLARPVFDRLVAQWVVKHGKSPSRQRVYELWQEAILETRDAKRPAESLYELREQWAQVFSDRVSIASQEEFAKVLTQAPAADSAVVFDADQHQVQVVDAALTQVHQRRAWFKKTHVDVAIAQQLKKFRFVSDQHRKDMHDQLVDFALEQASVRLEEGDSIDLPEGLKRADGKALDYRENSAVYTTVAHVGLEEAVVAAMDEPLGVVVSEAAIDGYLRQHEADTGVKLNAGQEQIVRAFLVDGAAVSVAVGPAGTGKTTSMKAVAELWGHHHGPVIGVAPSAAAAKVLEQDITVPCRTVDSLVTQWQHWKNQGIAASDLVGDPRWPVQPGALILVDEAGMLSTTRMHAVIMLARECGAKVAMVGDPYQLDAVETGGLFRTLVKRPGVAHLTDVLRQKTVTAAGDVVVDVEQTEAVTNLRGSARPHIVEHAVDVFDRRGWLVGGSHNEMIMAMVEQYLRDSEEGKTSLVMATTNADVRMLNEIIQHEFMQMGKVNHSHVVSLADGLTAGVGDHVVARRNTVLEHAHGVSRVYNGQTFIVTKIRRSGAAEVLDRVTKQRLVLTPEYLTENTQLAYASTVHRAQGATVDTAHVLMTPGMDKNAAYVAVTRGKWANKMYAVTDHAIDFDAEDAHLHHAGDSEVKTARDVVSTIFTRDDAQKSALDMLADAQQSEHDPQRIRALLLEGLARTTRDYAHYVVDSFLDALPVVLSDKIDQEGHQAMINQVTYAANHGVAIEEFLDEVATDLRGAHNPGLVVAARVRDYVDMCQEQAGENENKYLLPPPHRGADFELRTWLESARAQILGQEKHSAQTIAKLKDHGVNFSLLENPDDIVVVTDKPHSYNHDDENISTGYHDYRRDSMEDHEL
ncbi:TrwC relaxase/AAA domain (plasmid) [Corynebacterium mustelae]|uniref:TrwC relaxase/AAA domain n=1 Tax=Corynebacterium mustelae TaxID=571915 RepID=A0A0G3H8B8_9CORY|nr:TrwC relaxase/AAA domain [Corynebacterium mustelae]